VAKEFCAKVMVAGTHGTTFGGNPFATTVGVATVTAMLEDKLADRADRVGAYLTAGLRDLGRRLPAIKPVRGKGLLVGIDIDRPAGAVVSACRERGLLILTAGDQILRMTPPLVIEEADVDEALGILEAALGGGQP